MRNLPVRGQRVEACLADAEEIHGRAVADPLKRLARRVGRMRNVGASDGGGSAGRHVAHSAPVAHGPVSGRFRERRRGRLLAQRRAAAACGPGVRDERAYLHVHQARGDLQIGGGVSPRPGIVTAVATVRGSRIVPDARGAIDIDARRIPPCVVCVRHVFAPDREATL